MDYEFSSQKELYQRVRPALLAKVCEVHRLGYSYISEVDIWNYLINEKWKNGKDLMLSDIVSDIMNVDSKKIDSHLKGKITKTRRMQNFDLESEII